MAEQKHVDIRQRIESRSYAFQCLIALLSRVCTLLRPGITFEFSKTVKCRGNQIQQELHLKAGCEENQALLHFAVLASLMSSPITINMKAWK